MFIYVYKHVRLLKGQIKYIEGKQILNENFQTIWPLEHNTLHPVLCLDYNDLTNIDQDYYQLTLIYMKRY